ncbi:MAG: hypothetical protein AB7P02_02200 [Alphaproteobacteria bacterium]
MRRILLVLMLCLFPVMAHAQTAPSIRIVPPRVETQGDITAKQVAVVVAAVVVGVLAGEMLIGNSIGAWVGAIAGGLGGLWATDAYRDEIDDL